MKDTEERHAREKEAAEKANKELTEERGTVQNLGTRIGQLERQLATQTTEAEIMGRRIADMEMRLTEQSRLLADRERERDQLRVDVDSARRIEADLRQELGTIERRNASATEALRAEKMMAETQLERAREDRAKLQREVTSMKREAEATWASERVENALLRERINDVAAEVARLTSVLEGPGSTIDTILAAPEPAGANGAAKPASRRRRTPMPRTARAALRIASAPCRRARRGSPPRRDRARRASSRFLAALIATAVLASLAHAEDREIAKRRAAERKTFTDAQIFDGFFKTAFGAEMRLAGRADRIRKYDVPMRVYVENRAQAGSQRAGREVVADIKSKRRRPRHRGDDGSQRRECGGAAVARARLHPDAARRLWPRAGAPHPEIARAAMPLGIPQGRRNSASSIRTCSSSPMRGDFIFYDCVYEELLQSLGPINDTASVPWTMFNDDVQMGFFGVYDQYILNILYHPRVRAGMTRGAGAQAAARDHARGAGLGREGERAEAVNGSRASCAAVRYANILRPRASQPVSRNRGLRLVEHWRRQLRCAGERNADF